MDRPLESGAVMYDPKVSVIWEIIRTFFEAQACPIDVAFYSTYELQVGGLLDRTIDIAWNSPLAWLDSQRRSGGTCRAVAMRDTDRDRVSYSSRPKTGRCARSPTCGTGLSRPARATRRRRPSSRSDNCGSTASIQRPTSASGTSTCSSASTGIMSAASATPSNVSQGRGGGVRDARSELGGLDQRRYD